MKGFTIEGLPFRYNIIPDEDNVNIALIQRYRWLQRENIEQDDLEVANGRVLTAKETNTQ